jgi:hypothetical protein
MTTHEYDPTVEARLDDEQIRNVLAVALSNPTLAPANARIVYDEMVDRLMPVVGDLIAAAEQRGAQRFIAETAADRPDSAVLFFAGRNYGVAEASAPVLALCDNADFGDYDGLAGAVRTADLRAAVDLPVVTSVFNRERSAAYRDGYADGQANKPTTDPEDRGCDR